MKKAITKSVVVAKAFMLLCVSLHSIHVQAEEYWRGLVVSDENRCSPYDKKSQYPYPQSVEDDVIVSLGGRIYGPYTGRYFDSDRETDIEHIVAASEGHDSGLCSATAEKREQFATDTLNLTLAAPEVNRCGAGGKCGFDPAEWMPDKNQCWFADRVVKIKTKYGLSVDKAEAEALEAVLQGCDSVDIVFYPPAPKDIEIATEVLHGDPLDLYDDNGNGRITCSEARAHKITPVVRSHPAYQYMRDADGDGRVCE
jgi:hypothetical protein